MTKQPDALDERTAQRPCGAKRGALQSSDDYATDDLLLEAFDGASLPLVADQPEGASIARQVGPAIAVRTLTEYAQKHGVAGTQPEAESGAVAERYLEGIIRVEGTSFKAY